jgi:hypothetical protein
MRGFSQGKPDRVGHALDALDALDALHVSLSFNCPHLEPINHPIREGYRLALFAGSIAGSQLQEDGQSATSIHSWLKLGHNLEYRRYPATAQWHSHLSRPGPVLRRHSAMRLH